MDTIIQSYMHLSSSIEDALMQLFKPSPRQLEYRAPSLKEKKKAPKKVVLTSDSCSRDADLPKAVLPQVCSHSNVALTLLRLLLVSH